MIGREAQEGSREGGGDGSRRALKGMLGAFISQGIYIITLLFKIQGSISLTLWIEGYETEKKTLIFTLKNKGAF